MGLLLNYRDSTRSVECAQSLLNQTIDKIVIWDNSADFGVSSTEIKQYFEGDDRVIVIVSDTNLGFSAGVNRGLDVCLELIPDAWVLLINNDARLLPGALSKLARSLSENPSALLAFPRINHRGRELGVAYYQRFLGLLSWRRRRGYFPYASGCCMLIATNRLELPLFDEDFFMYGEDCELGWRCLAHPHTLGYVNETLAEHDGIASSGMGSMFYESQIVAAHLILARKLAKNDAELWAMLACRMVVLPMRALFRAVRFHSVAPLMALYKGAWIAFSPAGSRVHRSVG